MHGLFTVSGTVPHHEHGDAAERRGAQQGTPSRVSVLKTVISLGVKLRAALGEAILNLLFPTICTKSRGRLRRNHPPWFLRILQPPCQNL